MPGGIPAPLLGQLFSSQNSVLAVSPVQISSIVRNPSAMTVSAMLSTVTETGLLAR